MRRILTRTIDLLKEFGIASQTPTWVKILRTSAQQNTEELIVRQTRQLARYIYIYNILMNCLNSPLLSDRCYIHRAIASLLRQ